VMVRLAGCNLDCNWCDTPARSGGQMTTVDDVLAQVEDLNCRRVEVTGGEPLIQPACLELLKRLCDGGYETLLETNGSVDISVVDRRVAKVVDIKCPACGQSEYNLWSNMDCLVGGDEVKFVLADRRDYEYAKDVVARHGLVGKCEVIFSPVWNSLPLRQLAEWILADRLDARVGVQLHKVIWPDAEGGV